MAMKPLDGTFANNALVHEVAGINVDGCRINSDHRPLIASDRRLDHNAYGPGLGGSKAIGVTTQGRWPANLLLDEEAAALLDEQSGTLTSNSGNLTFSSRLQGVAYGKYNAGPTSGISDSGGASRFFYVAKASKRDRDEGLGDMELREAHKMSGGECIADGRTAAKGKAMARNHHPTVKPTQLMRYLCRMVTRPNGVILDPFMGSGSTGKAAMLEGFGFTGIEIDPGYFAIAQRRIADAQAQPMLLEVPA